MAWAQLAGREEWESDCGRFHIFRVGFSFYADQFADGGTKGIAHTSHHTIEAAKAWCERQPNDVCTTWPC